MFEAIQGPVLDLAEALQGALLYLDAGAGEIAQTTLGLPFLLGLGVTQVCSLETASPEDAAYPVLATGTQPTRLAIFTTQLLTDAHEDVMRAVLAHPAAASLAIYSSVSEHAHACQAATDLGVEAYREYGEMVRAEARRARAAEPSNGGGAAGAASDPPAQQPLPQQQQQPLSVRVAFLPLLAVCMDPCLFVLPAASSAARRAVSCGRAAGFGPADPSPDAAVGEGASGGLALTAHALLALAAALGAPRPEPFPIGPVSTALATELASLPSVSIPSAASAPGSGPSLALILVDRSLDLAAPCAHTDHPWDLLLAEAAARHATNNTAVQPAAVGRGGAGPQVLGRPVDLRAALPGADPVPLHVPWTSLPASLPADRGLPYGHHLSYGTTYGVELLDPSDRTAISRVEAVAGRSRKDGLAALRRALKEALRSEKLTPAVRSKAGTVQAAELRGLAESLAAAPGACSRQRGVAALGLALAEGMTSEAATEWAAAAGLERSVLAALAGADGGGGGGGGSGGCEAAVQVLLDALAAARNGRGLLHVGHVLEVLPAAFSAAADSDASATSSSSSSSSAHGGGGGSASCPFSPQQQEALRAALVEAVISCGRPAEALGGRLPADLVAGLAAAAAAGMRGQQQQRLPGEGSDESAAVSSVAGAAAGDDGQGLRRRVTAALDGLFAGLRFASGVRGRLKTFRKVTHMDMFAENHGSLNPLLRQVVRKVLQRAEVTDWQLQAASAGGGLVRGLLGGLMGASRVLVSRAAGGAGGGALQQQQQQLPGEFGTVVVFVVGGISAAEVREIRAELDEHVGPGKPRVIVGGTSLLLPQDVALQLAPLAPPPPQQHR